MVLILAEIIIKGSVQKVFDIVTQARFWPEWEVSTLAVKGVVERPYRLGDEFTVSIDNPKGPIEMRGRVQAYDRPHLATIELHDSPIFGTITYQFTPAGKDTLFRRVLTLGGPQTAQITTERQSASVQNLKALVDRILADEQLQPALSS